MVANNGLPNWGVVGIIIKYYFAIVESYAKFLPEMPQIDGIWIIAHFFVETVQHVGVGRLVSNRKYPLDVPRSLVITPPWSELRAGNLVTLAVLCALSNLDVSDQTEHCSAPIRSSPGRRVVETSIAGGGLSLWHVKNELLPHL